MKIEIELPQPLKDIEKQIILKTLELNNYNRTATAKALGVDVRTIRNKLNTYGLKWFGIKIVNRENL